MLADAIEVLPPGFQLDFVDLFDTSIPVEPIEFENGGILVEFGEGTDLSNLGDSVQINFTASKAVPEPQTTLVPLLLGGLMFTSLPFESTSCHPVAAAGLLCLPAVVYTFLSYRAV